MGHAHSGAFVMLGMVVNKLPDRLVSQFFTMTMTMISIPASKAPDPTVPTRLSYSQNKTRRLHHSSQPG